jgi:hypothetical protein
VSASSDWRGQWLSLHDLAVLMNKSYPMICKMWREGTLSMPGIVIFNEGRRVWVRLNDQVYDSLTRTS